MLGNFVCWLVVCGLSWSFGRLKRLGNKRLCLDDYLNFTTKQKETLWTSDIRKDQATPSTQAKPSKLNLTGKFSIRKLLKTNGPVNHSI